MAAGDTARWVIGDTASGAGAVRRTHILVKPSAAGLSTNLVIATDRRVYHLQLVSNASSAMASISWTYPEDALLALRGAAPGATEQTIAAGPLRDIALVGALRKAKQSERVSYETAIALARALGLGDAAATLETIRDEEHAADAALAGLLTALCRELPPASES